MKNYLALTIIVVSSFSCQKECLTPEQCFFVGKWCVWDSTKNECLTSRFGLYISEFKENGEYSHSMFAKGESYIWNSNDCKNVDINISMPNKPFGKVIITKITNDIIMLEDFYFTGTIINHRL